MGKNLIIIRNGNCVPMENRRTATRVTSARQNWALNAEDTVSITIESPFPQKYEIGDKINIFGRDYKLNRLPKVQKTGAQEFKYDLEFEGVQYDLFRVIYDLTIDTTNNELQDVSGESLTGDIGRFLTVLVSNANRVFPGKWKLGEYPKDTKGDTTITFSESDNCLSVLQTICQKFGKEFEIETGADGVHVINVKKIGEALPYKFMHGKGRGLYSLRRENVSSSNIITRLKVYGSTENITLKYRANRLCLPGKSKGQSYIEDAKVVAKYGIWEGRKVFDEIKPSFTGKVTGVVAGNILSFVDNTFPFDLNAKEADGKTTKYLLPDSSARIHFNTGNLAGFEFEVTKYDHATHTFSIKKQIDKRGDVFPSKTSAAFQFALGDEYKILNIAYSPDIEQRAEMELQETGTKYYKQNCQPKVQYTCAITERFLQGLANAPQGAIANIFVPGDYVHIIDEDIDVDKSIRIKSFQRDILHPYDYQLTISDIPVTISVTNRVFSELIDIDKIIEINDLKDATKARANWRSSREVLGMVFDPEGDYYTEKIKPNSIDTLALSVGAKSMQFGLINTIFKPNHKGNSRNIVWKGGVLTHYTINPEHAVSWVLGDGSLMFNQTDDKTAFYIYAKCPKDGSAGTIVFTTQQHKVDGDAMNYYFWIGVLNSIDIETNARALSLTYGFTMINGRFIKTGRIESADGTTYFDLDNSEIGGRIVFSSNGQEKTLEELGKESLENKDFINNTLPGILSEIQSQLDGQIEQFFETYDPTLTNAPAKDWTTTQLKESHLGDLFYNTESGKVFRFIKNGSVYSWQVLQDSEVAQALALANDALALAKTKRRIFTSTPYTPYEIGDLWVQGGSGDIMRCKVQRLSGGYNAADWVKACKYTDDSKLNEFIGVDFADLKANALRKETIIEGGYLKNSLIDTENLIVKKVFSKDGKFKILDDGSMEGTSGTFSGYLKTNFHLVEESDAIYTKDSSQGQYGYKINKELNLKVDMDGKSDGANIILPNEIQYIGSRVILHNGCYPPYTKTVGSIRKSSVCIDDGGQIRGLPSIDNPENLLSHKDPNKVIWINGVIELIGVIEEKRYSPSLLNWRGQSNNDITNPLNGNMYYNIKKSKNYIYWNGQWNEIPAYGNSSIIWKGKLNQKPTNPEKNWMYVTNYDYVLIYSGTGWNDITNDVIWAKKCGWSVLNINTALIESIF